jgi:hypothetical protein
MMQDISNIIVFDIHVNEYTLKINTLLLDISKGKSL